MKARSQRVGQRPPPNSHQALLFSKLRIQKALDVLRKFEEEA